MESWARESRGNTPPRREREGPRPRPAPHAQKSSRNGRERKVYSVHLVCLSPASPRLRGRVAGADSRAALPPCQNARAQQASAPARPWQGRRRGNLGPGSEAQVGAPQGAGTVVPDSSRLDLVPEFPTAKSPLSRPELSVTSARCFLFPGEELFCSSQFKGRVCASELWASLHASASGGRAPSAGARPCGARPLRHGLRRAAGGRGPCPPDLR